MLKRIGIVCAALLVGTAAFSASAEAQFRGGGSGVGNIGGGGARMGGFGGGGVRMGGFGGGGPRIGGANFGGARIGVGNFGGARMGGAFVGGPRMDGARFANAPMGGRFGINRPVGLSGGAGFARNPGIYSGARWAGRGFYGHRRYARPFLGLGVGAVALASAWPYYSNYGYSNYGYDTCYVTRRVWTPYGWTLRQVYVCEDYYGGYNGYGYW